MKLVRRADGQVVIYSIGRDGVDDGGAPLDWDAQKGDIVLVLGK